MLLSETSVYPQGLMMWAIAPCTESARKHQISPRRSAS